MQEFIDRIQQGDRGAIAGLWDEVKNYAYKVASHYDGLAEPEDLRQEAFIGVVAAAEHYSTLYEVPFLPYMGKCVARHLMQYITQNGAYIPINKRSKVLRVTRYKNEYYMRYGRSPKDCEVCHALGITAAELQDLYLVAYMQVARSTAEEIGEDLTLGDTIADPEDIIETSTHDHDRTEMAAALWDVVDSIDGGGILRMIYQEGMTLQEIAEEKNVAHQTVQAKRNRLLRKIRTAAGIEKIKSYKDEYMTGLYKRGGLASFRHTGMSEPEWIALKRMTERAEDYRFIYCAK